MTQDAVPPNRPDKLIRNSTAEFLIFTAQEGARLPGFARTPMYGALPITTKSRTV